MLKRLTVQFFLGSLLFYTAACSTFKPMNQTQGEGAAAPHEIPSYRVSDPEPPQVVNEELEHIPEEMNDRIEMWVRYFQGKGRPHMERYLSRSTRYIGLMKKILRENGLPEDLIYIALIESGFSSRATSHAAAVGYWQFIKGTGRRYGLEINQLIDERRDPVLSTQAAAEYFKGLYSMFGSWYLSMASYNVGENRVKREIIRNKTNDFWVLLKKRRLPRETLNYVPKFIAAKMIAKNPEKFGFTAIDYEKPLEFELIKVDRPLNLKSMAANMSLEYEDVKLLNPKFKGEIAPTKQTGTLELRVPVGQRQVALNAAMLSFVDKVEYVADAGETETYRIRSGDSLYSIARRYRTSVAWLRDTNDIKPGKKLRIGMRIQVPDRSPASHRGTTQKLLASAKVKVPKAAPMKEDSEVAQQTEIVNEKGVFYVVQNGDTLSEIAEQYDSTISELRKMNRLNKRTVLRAGMKLRVPKDEGLPTEIDSETAKTIAQTKKSLTHKVLPGENLNTIATRYGVTVQDLKRANNLKKRTLIRAGSELVLPSNAKNPEAEEESPRSPANGKYNQRMKKEMKNGSRLVASTSPLNKSNKNGKSASKTKVHVVRRGENLSMIADRYETSVYQIKLKNKFGSRQKLFVGTRLLIPIAEASY